MLARDEWGSRTGHVWENLSLVAWFVCWFVSSLVRSLIGWLVGLIDYVV